MLQQSLYPSSQLQVEIHENFLKGTNEDTFCKNSTGVKMWVYGYNVD